MFVIENENHELIKTLKSLRIVERPDGGYSFGVKVDDQLYDKNGNTYYVREIFRVTIGEGPRKSESGPQWNTSSQRWENTTTLSWPPKEILREQRKNEAKKEAERRFIENYSLLDRWQGLAKAIVQFNNSGTGGGTVGPGILNSIANIDSLVTTRETLLTSIDSMTNQELIDLDVSDDIHWS